jgi:hypothetical protein
VFYGVDADFNRFPAEPNGDAQEYGDCQERHATYYRNRDNIAAESLASVIAKDTGTFCQMREVKVKSLW